MKKIMFFFVSFIFCFLHAENNNFVLRLYYPYGGDIRYTEEFKFYDDGLVKQMIHYDLRDEVDYYQWDNIKKGLKKDVRKLYIRKITNLRLRILAYNQNYETIYDFLSILSLYKMPT